MVTFSKMNGAGNDFVVLDNRELKLDLTGDQIATICQRQRGVGADGLLAVEPAQNGADYRMRYYNADGGEAEMCGNGARCFARFVNRLEGGELSSTSFETIAGVIEAEFVGEEVKIQLSQPFDLSLDNSLSLLEQEAVAVHSVNTGVPHAVVFVENAAETDVVGLGRAIREHEHFSPAGTNANFVRIEDEGKIRIRTYERGVENETLACGTGMVACAIIYHEKHGLDAPIEVTVAGGDTLEVSFSKDEQGDYHDVTLLGPADFTFEGTLSAI